VRDAVWSGVKEQRLAKQKAAQTKTQGDREH